MAWLRRRKIKRTGRVHYYLAWRDEDGAERTRPLNTTDKIVAEALLREHQRASGELPAAPRGAPAEILEQFLAEKAVQFRPKTVADYRDRLGPLFAAWSDHPMETWTRAMFVSHVEGMGPRSVQILVGQCRRLIEWARGLDLPLPDFVGDFKPPAVRSEERTALTVEEEAAVMKVARGGRLEAPIALALYGGMPRADFLALEWRQVDLEAGTLTYHRSKTGQRVEVGISPALDAALRPVRALAGPVCRGLPMSDSSLSKALHRLLDKADVPRGGWHRFRHTYATRLVASGCDLPTLQALMGHRPGSPVTLRYFHTDTGRQRDAIRKAFGG